uniref:Tonoplast intrinsic protein n=1 Tax=Hordeum vulgare subsp. vulgare TaxID=112509 RepID=D2KZ42_HORVV|nr:tonoplast intrinsic protein [Hordeum vulgare subsp. vulgare]
MAATKHADSFDEREVAVVDAGCVRAVLGELVLTFLFVFTGVAAAMAAGVPELPGAAMPMATLAGVALAQALAAGVLVTAGFHVSGGHLNPAVTVALLARGHITAFRAVLYVVAQLLASSLACILLRCLTGGQPTPVPVHTLGAGIGPMQGLVMEIILTFSLLFVVYATILDPRTTVPGYGPMLTGLIVGANTIAGGNFSGASMNPARSFGPALATGVWTNHWIYWVGPLVGGPLAGFVYEMVFMVKKTHEPLLGWDF